MGCNHCITPYFTFDPPVPNTTKSASSWCATSTAYTRQRSFVNARVARFDGKNSQTAVQARTHKHTHTTVKRTHNTNHTCGTRPSSCLLSSPHTIDSHPIKKYGHVSINDLRKQALSSSLYLIVCVCARARTRVII